MSENRYVNLDGSAAELCCGGLLSTADCLWAKHFAKSYYVRRKRIQGRKSSTLMYVVKGRYIYHFGNHTMTAEEGSVVYVPEGACYIYEIDADWVECWQIEFRVTEGAETLRLFSDEPVIAFADCPTVIQDALRQIVTLFPNVSRSAGYMLQSELYQILSVLTQTLERESGEGSRVSKAIGYIRNNCAESVSAAQLAELCGLSVSHMRKLFKEETGLTPVQFRNRQRIAEAQRILACGSMTISEIAYSLGFENVYEFSKLFKRETGMSPRDYKKSDHDPRLKPVRSNCISPVSGACHKN